MNFTYALLLKKARRTLGVIRPGTVLLLNKCAPRAGYGRVAMVHTSQKHSPGLVHPSRTAALIKRIATLGLN